MMFLLITNILPNSFERIFVVLFVMKPAVGPEAIRVHVARQFGKLLKDSR